jgi:hypothetical protein
MMGSLLRVQNDDHGSMAVKPLFHADGHEHGWMAGVNVGSTKAKGKGKAVATAVKPWADQPWPLIDTPSSTQSVSISFLFFSQLFLFLHKESALGYRIETWDSYHVIIPSSPMHLYGASISHSHSIIKNATGIRNMIF